VALNSASSGQSRVSPDQIKFLREHRLELYSFQPQNTSGSLSQLRGSMLVRKPNGVAMACNCAFHRGMCSDLLALLQPQSAFCVLLQLLAAQCQLARFATADRVVSGICRQQSLKFSAMMRYLNRFRY
jgi:hypothetical protein